MATSDGGRGAAAGDRHPGTGGVARYDISIVRRRSWHESANRRDRRSAAVSSRFAGVSRPRARPNPEWHRYRPASSARTRSSTSAFRTSIALTVLTHLFDYILERGRGG